ncbi:N-acetylmuramoyl-L-alanine amidase [Nocardioides marmorisolisilvae]|uniref:N-acetylmuramoyl-L-alanine amidase n=2 Tax=Nocardioides marmorisolisilvae TaxID=1542737 RepID=A0A3N0DQ83_9ACTN|nr:N-acetylmuramoyl-L-alanine amidase [Nocardioides marmorisolisilvae]
MAKAAALLAAAAGAVALVASAPGPSSAQRPTDPGVPVPPVAAAPRVAAPELPLAGVRIALDPGHQLGNGRFPAMIQRLVPAGGFVKQCNTTGTETNGGYPEATFNYTVMRLVQARLEKLGATVLLDRTTNSESAWGPCVDQRGRFGATVHADLTVSLHADGAPAYGHGFHVITPAARNARSTEVVAASRRLALALRSGFDDAGLARSNYINHGFGLDTRWDLATLNLSDVPVAMVEAGNMRNAGDARRMTSPVGRARYAGALVAGIRDYLGR